MVTVSVAEPVSSHPGEEIFQPEPVLDGLRILLVDDDADTRDAVGAVLADCGAQVMAFDSAWDALAAVRGGAPDVVVSDIAMPGMDGHALIRKIRALGAQRGAVPAIALTAYASPADRTLALLAGYQVFLPKPFDPTQLVTLVARLAGVLPGA
jgi:CheY-like chemotaxis protein